MRKWWTLFACGLFGPLGCSLLVDTAELDEGCPSDEKFCNGACVKKTDPRYSCAEQSCAPCVFEHAIPGCDAGRCYASQCLYGYSCDDCAVNVLTDEANCGTCRNACGAGQRCVSGVCSPP